MSNDAQSTILSLEDQLGVNNYPDADSAPDADNELDAPQQPGRAGRVEERSAGGPASDYNEDAPEYISPVPHRRWVRQATIRTTVEFPSDLDNALATLLDDVNQGLKGMEKTTKKEVIIGAVYKELKTLGYIDADK